MDIVLLGVGCVLLFVALNSMLSRIVRQGKQIDELLIRVGNKYQDGSLENRLYRLANISGFHWVESSAKVEEAHYTKMPDATFSYSGKGLPPVLKVYGPDVFKSVDKIGYNEWKKKARRKFGVGR